MSNKKTYQGIIDRFEGDFAVLLIGPEQEERIDFPKTLLPNDASESDIISLSINVKKNKTAKAKKDVMKMIEDLKKQNK